LRRRIQEAGGELDPDIHEDLLGEIRAFSESTLNDKAELFPPGSFLRNFRVGGILRLLAGEVGRGMRRTLSPGSCRARAESGSGPESA